LTNQSPASRSVVPGVRNDFQVLKGRIKTRSRRTLGHAAASVRSSSPPASFIGTPLRDGLALAAHDRGELRSLEDVGAAHDEWWVDPWLLEEGTMPKCGTTRGKTGLIFSCGPKSSDLFGLRGCSRSVSISTR
jgi:hypothetical protein